LTRFSRGKRSPGALREQRRRHHAPDGVMSGTSGPATPADCRPRRGYPIGRSTTRAQMTLLARAHLGG
jgi:hypothetical protein